LSHIQPRSRPALYTIFVPDNPGVLKYIAGYEVLISYSGHGDPTGRRGIIVISFRKGYA